jgi:cytochrome P450
MLDDFKEKVGKSFDPIDILYHAVCNIMTTFLVGRQYDKKDRLFRKLVELESELRTAISPSGKGVELDSFPWLRHFGHPAYKKMQRILDMEEELWDIMRTDQDGELSLVSALFEAHNNNHKQRLDEKRLMVTSIDMIVAGTSSTVNTLYSFLNIISHHQDIQTKMQAEMDKVVGHDRLISLSDKSSLPFTYAVMLELLRYTSVSPFCIPHQVITPMTLIGKRVRPGTILLMNLWALHHDETFWEEPFLFKPERFLGEDGTVVDASHPNRKHLLAFGAGPRVCVGEVLAVSRLFLMMGSLIKAFVVAPGKARSSFDPRDYPFSIFLSPEKYEIVLHQRQLE